MSGLPELDSLNDAQRAAVLHCEGSLLILAGAGSGKTRVITVKIAWLIRHYGVSPHSILAVTFTNKAAGEMRQRAAAITAEAGDAMIRTFHSFGAWMLRRNAAEAGLSRTFSIYDDDDAVMLLRSIYPEENRATLVRYARQISRAKDYGLRAADNLDVITHEPEFTEVYRAYQERLQEIGNVDFGELILKPVELLRDTPAIRTRLQQRFRYILVDEYQDSNVAQHELLKQLANDSTYVCVVGDDDQSIYRFRGAEVRNILTFADTFPGTSIVKLEQNYRSTNPILEVAGAVVRNNVGRLGKTLWTDRAGGDAPTVNLLRDQDHEVEFCLSLIEQDDVETAILYRTNAQSRLFETAFLRANVPYRIVGSLRFYEREEIKDALALLRLVANRRDEISFRRIVNKPTRGLGDKSVQAVADRLTDARGDLFIAAEAAIPKLSKRAASALRAFVDTVTAVTGTLGTGTLSDFTERLIRDSGLWEHHAANTDEVTAKTKLENLEELVNAASLYPATEEGLSEFLELIELDQGRELDADESARVTLITMHNTKGLEFDRVIITGLEEGLFPRGADTDPDEIEEERRLFYVAVTRARDQLHLCSCASRRLHGQTKECAPSRFLNEIPSELIARRGLPRTGHPAGARARAASTAAGLPPGAAVYHDDYGAGVVTRSWDSDGEPVVQVQFETGRTARFLTRYSTLERIAGDL
ncbi:MAG: DNA/RNA helicase [Spirochaetaceae bacterium]|nr:MAG: DNA/RNA helicase [Spirochaetaceae bacterium]